VFLTEGGREGGVMFRAFGIVLVTGACSYPALGQCRPAPDSLQTIWGHQNAVIVNSKPLKKLQGNLLLGYGGPEVSKDGVLVEVFDHPELALSGDQNRTGQRRLRACVTQKDGSFSFDLPAGKYELRCSKPVEWNCTSVVVDIDKKGSSKSLSVRLELAE
jgi:hypothetical protein